MRTAYQSCFIELAKTKEDQGVKTPQIHHTIRQKCILSCHVHISRWLRLIRLFKKAIHKVVSSLMNVTFYLCRVPELSNEEHACAEQ